MTFVSLTQAAVQLGIDGKTLQRWLAAAQLTPQAHPSDTRQKGLSLPQLHQLARLHQRRLASLSSAEPDAAAAFSAEPADLLALQASLAGLAEQLTAIQQQLGLLAQRLEPTPPPPAAAAVPAKKPAPPKAPPPPPTPPAKPVQVLPRVEYAGEGHYVILCPTHGVLPFEPDSREWVGWLASQTAFRFVGHHGRFTAHREVARLHPRPWRAHRNIRNHTRNLPLAHSEHLTLEVLETAAETLQAHLR